MRILFSSSKIGDKLIRKNKNLGYICGKFLLQFEAKVIHDLRFTKFHIIFI